jgi:hypothetical protein
MTKIAYNACYGGFSLSEAAIERYLALTNQLFWKEKTGYQSTIYYLSSPETAEDDRQYFNDHSLSRDDQTLIQVIEELGEAANGSFAKLTIKDLPPGTRYRIQEYDGSEWIETEADIEWLIA